MAVRVLIVDDERDFSEPLAFWLKGKGYDVECMTNPVEAIRQVEAQPPDVLLIDVHMPEMSGIDALKQVRTFNETLPVVVITSDAEAAKHSNDETLALSAFFPKHHNLDELAGMIEVMLRNHSQVRARDRRSGSE